MRLTIVIPACNEENRIGRMLDAYVPHFIAQYGESAELIVVINGSTDGTEALVREYAKRWPVVRCIVEPGRIGKGGALIRGFEAARGEVVGFVDADGATPPEAFQELVDGLGDAGAIIASRWRKESRISPRQSLDRRIASRFFNVFTRLAFGLRLTDTQCGAKVMSRAALRTVLPRLGVTQWAFDVDLLFQLRRAGYRIKEIPTTWRDIAGSKVEVLRASSEMLAALTRLRLLYSPLRGVVGLYDRYLSPFIHPPGMEQDRLFRHSLIVLAGIHMANLFNLVFQILMMAMMSDVEYGVLSAMLGVFVVFGALAGALSQTVTRFAAVYARDSRPGRVTGLLQRLAAHLFLVAVPLLALLFLRRHAVAAFFRIDDSAAVLLTGLAVAMTLCAALLRGAMSGLQAFIWKSAQGVSASVVRLTAAVVLVSAGWAAPGGLSGQAMGAAGATILGAYALKQLLGATRAEPVSTRVIYPHFFRYLLASCGLAIMSGVDVPLVKHYFEPGEAGLFAKAATVARIVIFLPLLVSNALFSKAVSAGRTTAEHLRTLTKGTVLVLAMAVGVMVLCLALPGLVLTLAHSPRAAEFLPLMRGMMLALLPLSVVGLLMRFEFAQHRFAVGAPVLLCAAGYVTGAACRHPTLLAVVAWLAAASWAALLLSALCVWWNGWRERRPARVPRAG